MNDGKDFENQIKESIVKLKDVYYLRLEDPPQSFNITSSADNGLRFSNKNPYDFIMYHNLYMYAIECKSTKQKSISFARDKKEKSKSIKVHQIKGLSEAYTKGVIAGFFLNFRELKETYFLHIKDFLNFYLNTTKLSIDKNDVVKNNGILIPQQIKKVKYNYDIKYLLDTCESLYNEYKFVKKVD